MPHATDATIHDVRTISSNPDASHGWPTIGRRRNGELLVVCSGGRAAHVCPWGRLELIRSGDDGKTWSEPRILADGPIDDRDAGVIETHEGTLLVNWFTSVAWLRRLERMERGELDPTPDIDQWRKERDALDEQTIPRELGGWALRSTDGGQTWSERIDTLVNSPHGPTQLADGRLLYVGRLISTDDRPSDNGSPFAEMRVSVAESRDDGWTWQLIGEIPVDTLPTGSSCHEPHAVEAADGRIVAQLRYHGPEHRETLQSESEDGGRTWSELRSIGEPGFPSHLLRLRDDRLLMTVGHRYQPWSNRARISEDHGRTWSEPVVSLSEGDSRDIGYPSTVQLDDGSLISVWYEQTRGRGTKAELLLGHWSLA